MLIMSYTITAQNSGVGINTTGNNPDPSAGIDIDFTNKGILYPRLTDVQRDAIQNPAVGLQIYNTTSSCLQIFMPLNGWRDISCDCSPPPSSTFTFPDSSAFNSNVLFNSSASGLNYSWIFQNGTPSSSSSQSQSVTWSTPGVYAVSLTVTDNIGCTTTTVDSITILNCPPQQYLNQLTFSYTGSAQTWVVPPNCIDSILVDVQGAQGHASGSTNFGQGGRVQTKVKVTGGQTLNIYVGGEGNSNTGGWNGGGNGGSSTYGAGGGSSDIRINGTTLNDRIVVAGGGGGTGSNCGTNSVPGGHGGGLTGESGCANTINCSGLDCQYTGAGGTQSNGGAKANTTHGSCGGTNNGSFGSGGSNSGTYGTGGGGGWYGGGSGCFEGAGGGSSYTDPNHCSSTVIHTQGFKQGNGQITISW